MSPAAPVVRYVAVRPLPDIGVDVFTNDQPFTRQPAGRAVFGGLLLSQAISAASATVGAGFHVHSSHATFVRPVTATSKARLLYCVERVADGRSFATRVVRATQGGDDGDEQGPCVFMATVSFQSTDTVLTGDIKTKANVLDYGPPLPSLDGLGPDSISEDHNRQILAAFSGADALLRPPSFSEGGAFDWRPFGFVQAKNPWDCRVRSFVRSQGPLSDSNHSTPAVNLAALAYLSDESLIGIAMYANPKQMGKGTRNITMAATLNHKITFHDPHVKADEWMVLERSTSWGGNGRVLLRQQTWNLGSGRLIMTVEAECLLRLKPEADSKL
ncbi:Mannosyl-oligosaccharide 1-2-alpha-mannosidase [Apiospora marii]|uniref:Mannosyl-oligosaccharide 1-2-alpha-mannosidase n=1 Tax=Apiospora marii TaxID=335849 RepID=UPI003131A087